MSRFIKRCFYFINLSSLGTVLSLTVVLPYTSQGADIESQSSHSDKKAMVKHPVFSRAEDASYLPFRTSRNRYPRISFRR